MASFVENVNTAAALLSTVNTADISAVAANEANITLVATDIANVNTTATNIANVNTTATNVANINIVAPEVANVGIVATNMSGVLFTASNMPAIIAAPGHATTATNMANSATSAANLARIAADSASSSAGSASASKIAAQLSADSASGSAVTSKYWADQAAFLVTSGVIHDSITSSNTTWSSSKINTQLGTKEASLGNPASNGFILSSTTGGVRTWIAAPSTGTSAPTLSANTVSINETTTNSSITITNYEAGLTYSFTSSNASYATATQSGGTISIATSAVPNNQTVTITVYAKAAGVAISSGVTITVTVVDVPIVGDTAIFQDMQTATNLSATPTTEYISAIATQEGGDTDWKQYTNAVLDAPDVWVSNSPLTISTPAQVGDKLSIFNSSGTEETITIGTLGTVTTKTLDPATKGSAVTLSNGNLTAVSSGGGAWANTNAYATTTTGTSGKWYAEVTVTSNTDTMHIGIATVNTQQASYFSIVSTGYSYQNGGFKYNSTSASYGSSYTSGDVISIYIDELTGQVGFKKNGVDQGTAYTITASTAVYLAVAIAGSSSNVTINFGATPFKYPIPSGYKAWGYSVQISAPTPSITPAHAYFIPKMEVKTGASVVASLKAYQTFEQSSFADLISGVSWTNSGVTQTTSVGSGNYSGYFNGSAYAKATLSSLPAGTAFTLECKAKIATIATTQALMGFLVPALTYGVYLEIRTSKVSFYASSNGTGWDIASNIAGTTTLASNTLYHFVVEFTGTAYKVYVNGTLELTVTSSASITSSATQLVCSNSVAQLTSGSIMDDLSLWVGTNRYNTTGFSWSNPYDITGNPSYTLDTAPTVTYSNVPKPTATNIKVSADSTNITVAGDKRSTTVYVDDENSATRFTGVAVSAGATYSGGNTTFAHGLTPFNSTAQTPQLAYASTDMESSVDITYTTVTPASSFRAIQWRMTAPSPISYALIQTNLWKA